MVDISVAISAVNGIVELTKTALEIRDETKKNEALLELRGRLSTLTDVLLASQQDRLALLEELATLKEEIAKVHQFEADTEDYEFRKLVPDVLVYEYTPVEGSTKPKHYICPNCYTERKKSYLHETIASDERKRLTCDNCKFDQLVGKRQDFRAQSARIDDSWMG